MKALSQNIRNVSKRGFGWCPEGEAGTRMTQPLRCSDDIGVENGEAVSFDRVLFSLTLFWSIRSGVAEEGCHLKYVRRLFS